MASFLLKNTLVHILYFLNHPAGFALYLSENLEKHNELYLLNFFHLYNQYATSFFNPYIAWIGQNQLYTASYFWDLYLVKNYQVLYLCVGKTNYEYFQFVITSDDLASE